MAGGHPHGGGGSNPHGGGGSNPPAGGNPPGGHPPGSNQPGGHPAGPGGVHPATGIGSAQSTTGTLLNNGTPGSGGGTPPQTGQGSSPGQPITVPPTHGPPPAAPPDAGNIRMTPEAIDHIIHGDRGSQGGHIAGTGLPKKTEFPASWDQARILDAAHQVTQQGPPVRGPYPTRDANGNAVWAYNYEGTVDGVLVRTTVLENGEIRTAFPPNSNSPGVITNPSSPYPPPQGIPQGNPPRYSHPAVGGDGSWTWEGARRGRNIRVVQDAQGNVTTTDLGPA